MSRSLWPLAATLCFALALGACSSSRLGGMGPAPVQAAAAPPMAPFPDAVEAAPSGPVMSEPLPPLGGPGAVGPVGSAPLPGDVVAPSSQIASLPPQAAQPVSPATAPAAPPVAAPSGRSSLVGSWTARDASGASCRVQLSSSPALDLYRASAGACGNKDLAKITAWDYRDGEIYLYQPGGAVAARLRGSGGSLNGVLSKSGAPLTLSK